MMMCRWACSSRRFEGSWCLHFQDTEVKEELGVRWSKKNSSRAAGVRRWRGHYSSKRRNYSSIPHGDTFQKTWVFSNTAVRASDLAGYVSVGRESHLVLRLFVAGFCPWPFLVGYLRWVKRATARGVYPRKSCASCTLSTTSNTTWSGLGLHRGLHRGLRGERVVCNRLSHATASHGREKQRSVWK